MLARLRAYQLIRENNVEALLVSTVHDSIVVDCPEKMCYTIRDILTQAVEEVPSYCKRVWNYNFTLPLKCEVQWGVNKTDMKEF